MPTRNERREENQRQFQRLNQRLHDVVERQVPDATPVPFLCECAYERCMGRVDVSPGQWQSVAERPNHFLIIAGHPPYGGRRDRGHAGSIRDGREAGGLAVPHDTTTARPRSAGGDWLEQRCSLSRLSARATPSKPTCR